MAQLFDTPPQLTYGKGGELTGYQPRQRGALTNIGSTVQAALAPFLAAYGIQTGASAAEQEQYRLEEERTNLEFQKFLAKSKGMDPTDVLSAALLGQMGYDVSGMLGGGATPAEVPGAGPGTAPFVPPQPVPKPSVGGGDPAADFARFTGQTPPTELGLTGFKVGNLTFGQTPESKLGQDLYKSEYNQKLDIDKSLATQEGKEVSQKYGEASRVIQALRNLAGLGKAVDEDFPGGSGAFAQFTSDAANFRYAPAALQDFAEPLSAYSAQMQEVKLGMLPILSGQARYVVDLARAIQETVPPVGKVSDVRDTLLSQSVRNMMTLTYAIQNGFLGAKELQSRGIDPESSVSSFDEAQQLLDSVQLTEEQEDAIESAIDYVVDADAIRKGKQASRGKPKTEKGEAESSGSFRHLWEK